MKTQETEVLYLYAGKDFKPGDVFHVLELTYGAATFKVASRKEEARVSPDRLYTVEVVSVGDTGECGMTETVVKRVEV